MEKENIFEIGESIQHQYDESKRCGLTKFAVGRVRCGMNSTLQGEEEDVFWLVLGNPHPTPIYKTDITGAIVGASSSPRSLQGDYGKRISRDSLLGGILIRHNEGTYNYTQKIKPKGVNNVSVNIFNKAAFTPTHNGIEDILIHYANEETEYMFNNLKELLDQQSQDQRLYLKKLAEERAKQEAYERALEEERRLAEERAAEERRKVAEEARKKAEEEQRRIKEEAARLEEKLKADKEKIQTAQSFIRRSVNLRSQHLLDPFQETAKRSHLYDGVPLLINGGPGTGKTTTMIQRLKFLLSDIALKEHEVQLTEAQIADLTDSTKVNENWLFFSPTDLLLHYLQNNMREEELNANEGNTFSIDNFRIKMMRQYRLNNPDTEGPFKSFKIKSREDLQLTRYPQNVIVDFEAFCVNNITQILLKAYQLNTSNFSWHQTALGIKAYCKKAENVKDMEALMRLFNALFDNEKKNVSSIEQPLNEELKLTATKLKQQVESQAQCKEEVYQLFERWAKEQEMRAEETSEEVSEDEMDEEEMEAEEDQSVSFDFESKLFTSLKGLLKTLSLKGIDSKQKVSKRQTELKTILDKYQLLSDISLSMIGERAWFMKNYAFLCRGLQSNILSQLPRLYKLYRKKVWTEKSDNYNQLLLERLVKNDNNKRLHPDEINLMLGFINNLLLSIYRKSRMRFEALRHPYVLAYRKWAKHVIGIDEATDYTLLDYYMMYSFRHYEYASVTLCGDIMQGLNRYGITDWQELKQFIMPNLEVDSLNISYRQLPTLLNMAREMYKDDQGCYPEYHTKNLPSESEPSAIAFVSDDDEQETRWIAHRIVEVYNAYDRQMPSVAIFVGEDENTEEFVERLNDCDWLDSIKVVDCTGGKTFARKDCVRVFRLSEVKGMEFEVVFFHHIDKAIKENASQIMRRYLYVGISRATSHLAATFTQEEGNEHILRYFNRNVNDWKMH